MGLRRHEPVRVGEGIASESAARRPRPRRPWTTRTRRGQSMAEFALITPLFIVMLFMAITFGVIGQAALAVGQLAYSGARYAAVNPTLTSDQVAGYIRGGKLGSPTITSGGGAHLSVTVVQASGFGQPVQVTISYDLSSNPLVSSMSTMFAAFGLSQTLPTTLTASEIAMSE